MMQAADSLNGHNHDRGEHRNMKRPKLMFVVNVDSFFVSHRLPIAVEAIRSGYEVHLATAVTQYGSMLAETGIVVHPLRLRRGEAGLANSVVSFIELLRLFHAIRPDIIHLVTIKPVIFGGIAARILRRSRVVAAISGLGHVFIAQGWKARIRRVAVCCLYRIALGWKGVRVIFQNEHDRAFVSKLAGLEPQQCVLIRGSGVDLEQFKFSPLNTGSIVVMLAARLLAEKGVREFVAAARMVKQEVTTARFCLVGAVDPDNPSSISVSELRSWADEGIVELWGYRNDMHNVLPQATIVVLPSYREGLPKILLEAAACGRPTITTDVPGCRDAIIPNETGVLIPAQDSSALAAAILTLIRDEQRCERMGKRGRKLVESEFDLRRVVNAHIHLYSESLLEFNVNGSDKAG